MKVLIVSIMLIFACGTISFAETPEKDKKDIIERKLMIEETIDTRNVNSARPFVEPRKEEINTDRVIEALSLVVRYQHWREDQRSLQKYLERRYDYPHEEDPFTFKSRRLREILEEDKISDMEFENAIDDLQRSLDELKDYHNRKSD